ncbi:alpha-ketoglutarate-dependent dioxygenase AlkB [Shewanella sp. NIFS-20-20]|uniref:alpha-ketoglutarate-dependent dioxygenase AlkB family protein n=1 Tax=Shewanella sp. NIFS-20-20 TaxID=2853806 RepID=UPI001C43E7DD|nr:alpha-ketoglutarate-dependent dioxygenase AlkB [Shewanella sp. NIFS-20-20]MBV7317554.1 alpha-ketoglutarate-dependent dioxygenase AlkB [Shewanella sp. NIFS-20-20]
MTQARWQPFSVFPRYLSQQHSQQLQDECCSYPWCQPEIRLFGRAIAIPRQQVWFADKGCDYRYSQLLIQALPWPPLLAQLRQQLLRDFGTKVNGVLANHYRNGQDSMGWHSDNEPEIVANSDIYSISLGASRDLCFRTKQEQHHRPEIHTVCLHHGDLLVMHAPMQQAWQHCVPKRARVTCPRWNLTFRQIYPNFHDR